MRSLNGPEPHFVRQLLVRDAKVLAPLFYVSKPFGWGIRVQPAIRCNAINDDGVPAKNATEKLDVLSVKTVSMSLMRCWRCAALLDRETYIGRLSFSESSFLMRFHARGPKCQLQSFLPPWSSFARFNE